MAAPRGACPPVSPSKDLVDGPSRTGIAVLGVGGTPAAASCYSAGTETTTASLSALISTSVLQFRSPGAVAEKVYRPPSMGTAIPQLASGTSRSPRIMRKPGTLAAPETL